MNCSYKSAVAVYWYGPDGSMSNCSFVNCSSESYGSTGSVDWFGDYGNLTNYEFIANNTNVSGGAIFWNSSNGTLSNSNFTGNKAHVAGAIRFTMNFTVIGCTFKGNTGEYRNILGNANATLVLRDCNLETIVKISQMNEENHNLI